MIEFGKKTNFVSILIFNYSSFRVGFSEMPDLSIKVVPTYGEKHYSYTLLQDFLAARIRAELKVWKILFRNMFLYIFSLICSDSLSYQLWMINFFHSFVIGLLILCKFFIMKKKRFLKNSLFFFL